MDISTSPVDAVRGFLVDEVGLKQAMITLPQEYFKYSNCSWFKENDG
jgi:hypothetical protein